MTKHSHSPYTSTHSSTLHNTNRKHNIHHIPNTNTQHISTLQGQKNTIFNNGRYTTNIHTDPHIVTTPDIKTNMRHIHTSIVSRHLATRGNNKILRTPPPHTSSSEERLPRLTRRTLAQLRTNKSPFLKSYLHKVDAKTHSSPLCPLCNINTHDTQHLFNCTHIRTTLSPLDLWTDPARLRNTGKCDTYVNDHNIIMIWSPNHVLCNYCMCDGDVYGQHFISSEHAYQWKFTSHTGRHDLADEMLSPSNPEQAKEVSSRVPRHMHKDWHSIKHRDHGGSAEGKT